MSRPITISLSPNTEADDIALAKRLLLRPTTWNDDSPIGKATAALEQLFPGYHATLLTSGRAALYRLLTALNINPGDEIITQAFTCSVVPAAIQWTGAIPIFADINPTDFNLDPGDVARKITPQTRALIMQHTFGLSANIPALQTLAKQHNLTLIEDCAHTLGSQYNNKPLGTFGAAAFFSFGRDKMLSSIFGGAIISRNAGLIKKINAQTDRLPRAPLRWVAQQLLHPAVMASLLPNYFTNSIGKVSLVALQHLRLISKVLTPAEKKGQPPPHLHYRYPAALSELLTHQLKKLPRYTERRQKIAARYTATLTNNAHVTLPEISKESEPAWLRYPILVENPAQLHQLAKQNHMLLGDWYDTVIAPRDIDARAFNYQAGNCPNAESVARRIINLPTYPTLTDDQVEQVIKFIEKYA